MRVMLILDVEQRRSGRADGALVLYSGGERLYRRCRDHALRELAFGSAPVPRDEQRATLIPVVVISLARSADRRLAISARLDALRVPFQFFDAIDGIRLSKPELLKYAPSPYRGQHGRRLTAGEVGCALSHIECARLASESASEFTCILEDDAELTPSTFVQFLDEDTLRTAIPTFDILKLAGSRRPPTLRMTVASIGNHNVIAPLFCGYNASGLIYSRNGAAKTFRNALPLIGPFDNMIFQDNRIAGLRILETRPCVVQTGTVASTMSKGTVSATLLSHAAKKMFLLARFFRSIVSFGSAWGLSSFLKLRTFS